MKGMGYEAIRNKLTLILLLIGLSHALFAKSKIDGDWEGTLQDGKLPMIFHIHLEGASTADSPKQNAHGFPAIVTLSGNTVKIDMPNSVARFEGVLRGSQIVGTFSQSGQNYPLTLTKSKKKQSGM